MLLKVSLHIHTKEDKKDGHIINYNVYQLIDEAKKKGFDVLGFTPHKKFVFKEEFARYAESKGILLIPGVELSLGRISQKHMIVLNCDKSAEKVKNFKQLAKYKQEHPNVFILAPHPTYTRLFSVGKRNLKRYINLFDAIEYSWLYSKKINANKKAQAIASKFNKPMVSTADVHVLKKLDTDYAMIDADFFNAESIFESIRQNRFENVTSPKKFSEIFKHIFVTVIKYVAGYIWVNILNLRRGEMEIVEETA
jgi:predicted metal-dependent phosphoesterase TrpH